MKIVLCKLLVVSVLLTIAVSCNQCHGGCKDGRNGRDGKDGVNGLDGKVGKPGKDGQDGRDGKMGGSGLNGRDGVDGIDGKNCEPTNWKECAYKAENSIDIGIIKSCKFNKKHKNTLLRVTVNANMRIEGCKACCKRWYVTFNGNECSGPVPLDIVVYMRNNGDLHRPRTIDGHCVINKSGEINVEFRIGDCPNYGKSDGHTGWNSSSRIYIEEVFPSQ